MATSECVMLEGKSCDIWWSDGEWQRLEEYNLNINRTVIDDTFHTTNIFKMFFSQGNMVYCVDYRKNLVHKFKLCKVSAVNLSQRFLFNPKFILQHVNDSQKYS